MCSLFEQGRVEGYVRFIMIYKLDFTQAAIQSISKYKKSNLQAYKKVCKLLVELQEHPRTGTGHPEALKSGSGITYSRAINKKDRLVYDIYDDVVSVLILTAEGHYQDK